MADLSFSCGVDDFNALLVVPGQPAKTTNP
jgi:hypothetical protein